MMKKYFILQRQVLLIATLILPFLQACKKFVEVDPPVTAISSQTVYTSNSTASAAMTGIFDNMMASTVRLSDGGNSIGYLNGLLADELRNYSTAVLVNAQCYTNALNDQSYTAWKEIYNEIYSSNAVIEGCSGSSLITASEKRQLTGEAKFMRAFLHFYATNLFGDVPLVTTTSYQTNNSLHRISQKQVYLQIIQDLLDAQTELSAGYVDGFGNTSPFRVRPNQGAATALLARAYLYYGDLTKDVTNYHYAELQASQLINNTSTYSLLPNLNQVFLGASDSQSNTEAIWQMQPVLVGLNTVDGYCFVLTSTPGTGSLYVSLSDVLFNAFESGDVRKTSWVGSFTTTTGGITTTYHFPYKYKVNTHSGTVTPTEYLMVLRLAEQYLIRAEARAQQGNIAGALADLNVIRNRAGLPNSTLTTSSSQAQVLAAILHERQVELFTEWGHRWFDMIRTGNINSVMGSPGNVCQAKGGTWNPQHAFLPIPASDIISNPNLTQTPGY